MTTPSIGLCFHRDAPAKLVVDHARTAEQLDFDEFWVIEDCFYTAGVSLAAAALTATDEITVGIGIMPAVARNAAITAMEIATLGALAPGRFHAGIGHGVQDWMRQMDAAVDSPLTVLDETITTVRSLLRGERVNSTGRYVTMRDVELDAAPDPVPLVSAGVRGPKSLQLAGRCADGTILADFCGPEYIRWAREQIGATPHRVTVFASLAISDDTAAAREAMSFHLADVLQDAPVSLRMAPFYDELAERAAATDWLTAVQAMPAEWWPQIAPVGSPDDCLAYIENVTAAGADTVAVFPSPFDDLSDAKLFAESVLSQLR